MRLSTKSTNVGIMQCNPVHNKTLQFSPIDFIEILKYTFYVQVQRYTLRWFLSKMKIYSQNRGRYISLHEDCRVMVTSTGLETVSMR